MNRKLCAALLLDDHSNHYQVKMRPDEAADFTAALGDYNNFDPDKAVKLIEKIDGLIPPMQFGPGNPNNGQPHHTYRLGREYSRVMYLDIVKAYMPASDYAAIAHTLTGWGHEAGADDAWVIEDEGTFSFGLWWD